MESKKYVCIHGHFYQPPRENAWLEVIEMQDSAAPFHDWNDRINFECYAPNTAARILGDGGQIENIINNYERISFNFGPTLLSWMEQADPDAYQAILEADKKSLQRFHGHGSAMAQVYNHIILPLANQKDKETQVIWGIADFESRFGRKPTGMWLAETAANTETLEVLADNGILFTVLAPRQAQAVKAPGAAEWQYLDHAAVDPRRPYRCTLPSGKTITLFFYDGGVSQGVAFSGLLNDGARFSNALLAPFDEHPEEAQLVHIATDGESYGHHHRFGEMALAACLQHLEEHPDVSITNYSQYMDLFPATWEARIHENSSWSCVHGIERWRSDCSCSTGGHATWNQAWRQPLRALLDWLRDQLSTLFETHAAPLLIDPWEARNDYIQVILHRTDAQLHAFLKKHAHEPLNEKNRVAILRLLEMQRNAMLMFTSCGWFFDEISGLETDQILQYANRAIHFAEQVAGVHLHNQFLQRLEQIPSNVYENGAVSYRQNVLSARADLVRVGMHVAASSIFEKYPDKLELFNYTAENEEFHRYEAGLQRLVIGRSRVISKITHSEKLFSFVALYLGQLNFIGKISVDMSRATFEELSSELIAAFKRSDLSAVIAIMEDHFGEERFSFWQLFRDEKRKILQQISHQNSHLVETAFREIYNDGYQLMTAIQLSGIPIPTAYQSATQFVLNQDAHQFFEWEILDLRELKRLASEFKKWNVALTDAPGIQLAASERIYREIQTLRHVETIDLQVLHSLNQILRTLEEMPIEINYWKSQNQYFSLLHDARFRLKLSSQPYRLAFQQLGHLLGFADIT